MSLTKLLEDHGLQDVLRGKLAAGESFEIVSLTTKEKMTSAEVKQKIDSKN